jgi:hypothetical protein
MCTMTLRAPPKVEDTFCVFHALIM